MKLPRDLSGATLIKLLIREFGYRRVNQVGSHVILETDTPRSHPFVGPQPFAAEGWHVEFHPARRGVSEKRGP